MTEQQAEALRSTAAALEDIADLVEHDFPPLDRTAFDEMIHDPAKTDTPFARTWTDIKQCVESHLTLSSVNETVDPNDEFDYLSLTGIHPDGNREMYFNIQCYQEASVRMEVRLPSRARLADNED